MRSNERLIMEILKKGPISLEDLCERSSIHRGNIWKYLRRLERGHFVIVRTEYVDGEEAKMVYPKNGYLHNPHILFEVGDPKW